MSLIEVLCSLCVLAVGFGTALTCWQTNVTEETFMHDKLATADAAAFAAERLIANLSVPTSLRVSGTNCVVSLQHGGDAYAGLTEIKCTVDGITTTLWLDSP